MAKGVISIDFWDTLVIEEGENFRQDERARILSSELLIPYGKIKEVLKDASNYSRDYYIRNKRTLSTVERVNYILDSLGITLTRERIVFLATSLSRVTLIYPPALRRGAYEFLLSLKNAGYIFVLMSDTGYTRGADIRELLRLYAIDQFFNYMLFSDELNYAKPSDVNFKLIEFLFPNMPTYIHIGDNPDTDYKGAVNNNWRFIGVDTVKYGSVLKDKTKDVFKRFDEILEIYF